MNDYEKTLKHGDEVDVEQLSKSEMRKVIKLLLRRLRLTVAVTDIGEKGFWHERDLTYRLVEDVDR